MYASSGHRPSFCAWRSFHAHQATISCKVPTTRDRGPSKTDRRSPMIATVSAFLSEVYLSNEETGEFVGGGLLATSYSSASRDLQYVNSKPSIGQRVRIAGSPCQEVSLLSQLYNPSEGQLSADSPLNDSIDPETGNWLSRHEWGGWRMTCCTPSCAIPTSCLGAPGRAPLSSQRAKVVCRLVDG